MVLELKKRYLGIGLYFQPSRSLSCMRYYQRFWDPTQSVTDYIFKVAFAVRLRQKAFSCGLIFYSLNQSLCK